MSGGLLMLPWLASRRQVPLRVNSRGPDPSGSGPWLIANRYVVTTTVIFLLDAASLASPTYFTVSVRFPLRLSFG